MCMINPLVVIVVEPSKYYPNRCNHFEWAFCAQTMHCAPDDSHQLNSSKTKEREREKSNGKVVCFARFHPVHLFDCTYKSMNFCVRSVRVVPTRISRMHYMELQREWKTIFPFRRYSDPLSTSHFIFLSFFPRHRRRVRGFVFALDLCASPLVPSSKKDKLVRTSNRDPVKYNQTKSSAFDFIVRSSIQLERMRDVGRGVLDILSRTFSCAWTGKKCASATGATRAVSSVIRMTIIKCWIEATHRPKPIYWFHSPIIYYY